MQNNTISDCSCEDSLAFELVFATDDYLTFSIKVKSGEFAGEGVFCMPIEIIESAIASLEVMYESLIGSCRMEDHDSDAYISIASGKFGHICISGQIGGSYEDQFVKFLYHTDQTELPVLIRRLKALL